MRTRSLLLPLITLVVVISACSSRKIEKQSGRLAFAKEMVGGHAARQMLLFDGEVWAPSADRSFVDQNFTWCDVSPNPNVEALRCYGNGGKTYVVTVSGGAPKLTALDEGLGIAWIDDDGKWMLGQKRFYNVETGEESPVQGISEGVPVANYLLGVSPDRRTVLFAAPLRISGQPELYYVLEIIDVTTGQRTKKKVDITKYPWVAPDPKSTFAPDGRRAASKHLEWKQDASGAWVLAVPEVIDLTADELLTPVERASASASARPPASAAPSSSR